MSTILSKVVAGATGSIPDPSSDGGAAVRVGARAARIALLGCGTVGAEVARRLRDDAGRLARACGRPLELVGVLVRDGARRRAVPDALVHTDARALLDRKPDVVIEALGGVEPARGLLADVLERGVPVVTANKTLLAHHGAALRDVARRAGTALAGEASVGAAIPLLAAIDHLRGDAVERLVGVLNGSCNHLLGAMERSGRPLAELVPEAQALGLLEPDPDADLSGRDTAEKLVVLAHALGHERATPTDVRVRGIADVRPADVLAAARLGRSIRLVGTLALADDEALRLAVEPVLLPTAHPLARLRGADNGAVITTVLGGELRLEGPGAGPAPTAAAILRDVCTVLDGRARARDAAPHRRVDAVERSATPAAAPPDAHGWYLRIPALGPDEVLHRLDRHDLRAVHLELEARVARVVVAPAPTSAVHALAATTHDAFVGRLE